MWTHISSTICIIYIMERPLRCEHLLMWTLSPKVFTSPRFHSIHNIFTFGYQRSAKNRLWLIIDRLAAIIMIIDLTWNCKPEMWTPPNVNTFTQVPRCSHLTVFITHSPSAHTEVLLDTPSNKQRQQQQRPLCHNLTFHQHFHSLVTQKSFYGIKCIKQTLSDMRQFSHKKKQFSLLLSWLVVRAVQWAWFV